MRAVEGNGPAWQEDEAVRLFAAMEDVICDWLEIVGSDRTATDEEIKAHYAKAYAVIAQVEAFSQAMHGREA